MTDVMVSARTRSGATRSDNREPGRPAARNSRAPVRAGTPAAKSVGADVGDGVLLAVTGIVDVLDNYAFVRTSGYVAGPDDVYVSMAQVRKYGLRRGDLVTGEAASGSRPAREGERQRDRYNPMVRLDTINGMDRDKA